MAAGGAEAAVAAGSAGVVGAAGKVMASGAGPGGEGIGVAKRRSGGAVCEGRHDLTAERGGSTTAAALGATAC